MRKVKKFNRLQHFKECCPWFYASAVRAIKTMAQTAVSLVTVGNLISEMDWLAILSVSATSGIASLLTSVAGLPELNERD